jgi:hypothetical protein
VVAVPDPPPPPPVFGDIWQTGLYETLRHWAAVECPDDLKAAVKRWCLYARQYTQMRRFRTWRTDFRRKQEAEDLLVLARLDVDAFFRQHPLKPPDDGGDGEFIASPPPLALPYGCVDAAPVPELCDA